jgi:TolB-like protein/Flp pilus assembly protein TadD
MDGGSPKPVSTPTGAVFLSYASQDAEAAQKVCNALRAAGVEVWFDQSELRGGDAWDRQIRQQIHNCRLFIAVISAHTEARDEGYFRREWRLAVERAGDMAEDKAFVVPLAIDGTSERSARVPDPFKHVQWTRLPGGETTSAFVERVRRLLSPDSSPDRGPTLAGSTSVPISPTSVRQPRRSKAGLWVAGAVIAVVLAAIAVDRFLLSRRSRPPTPPTATATQPAALAPAAAAAFNPPPHSVAVLPFVNMSGDKDQEYFSQGLTEELLNSLSRINELQVAARTSSFSFQGEHPDIATVAHKLNVAAVLEGSVRRSVRTVRITTQLINGVTGFRIWSQTYDRDLGDVLRLQSQIATAVADALKIQLLGDEAAKIELGGTRNPAAFDAYLRATKSYWTRYHTRDTESAIAGYTEAIGLDPNYALAYSGRSMAFVHAVFWATTPSAIHAGVAKAEADAREAIALAPNLGEGHQALALAYESLLEFKQASEEYERALALGPGNARALKNYGVFAAFMGRGDFGITLLRRALTLDPLNLSVHEHLGDALNVQRRYPEAIAAYREAETLDSEAPDSSSPTIGLAYFMLGDFESARSSCEKKSENPNRQVCLALTYDKLGRHTDAEAMLAKYLASTGNTGATACSKVYAQWGNTARALDWLETSLRVRNPDLQELKDPLFDPIRKEPRFQAVMRELKFPD